MIDNRNWLLFFCLCFFTTGKVDASQYYWNYSSAPGSNYYWKYGNKEGSQYFWKNGKTYGSQYFWKYGTEMGSEHYWLFGQGPGSLHYWNTGKGIGSRYFWEYGNDVGSKYHWLYGSKESFDQRFLSLCLGGVINIPICSYLKDNTIGAGLRELQGLGSRLGTPQNRDNPNQNQSLRSVIEKSPAPPSGSGSSSQRANKQ